MDDTNCIQPIQSGMVQSDFIRCKHCGKVIGEKISGSKRLDSLMVAKMLSKNHKDVLRDIKKIKCSAEFGRRNFALSSYTNEQNKNQPCIVMTHDGFNLLMTRYRSNQTDKSSYIEIKRGKHLTKIYGNEQLEIVCDRCRTVNVYEGGLI
jgi:Rha family phage regulatory protein